MIQFILQPWVIWTVLIVVAMATPLVAWGPLRGRVQEGDRWLLGAAGPVALLLWLIHGALLAVFGFDSVIALLLILAIGGAIGWWAGGRR